VLRPHVTAKAGGVINVPISGDSALHATQAGSESFTRRSLSKARHGFTACIDSLDDEAGRSVVLGLLKAARHYRSPRARRNADMKRPK